MIISTDPDENTLVMPDAWRRARHPRRDRPDVPPAAVPDEAAAERVRSLVDAVRDDIEHVLALPGTAPEIADAARAHLRGEPNALGAAATLHVAAMLNAPPESSDPPPDLLATEALVAGHGIAFAVHTFAEWAGIVTEIPERLNRSSDPPSPGRLARECDGDELRSMPLRHRRPDEVYAGWWYSRENARSLRTHLAAAPDGVYAEAVERLEGTRRHVLQKVIAAYLAPTRDDWVEDLWARPDELPRDRAWAIWMTFCALGRPHQPAELGLPLGFTAADLDVIASLIDGVGPGPAAPLLARSLERYSGETARTIMDYLAVIPADEAFQALLDRIGDSDAGPAVLAAARRFPARAMRLLPASRAPKAADLLAAHVRAKPAVAAGLAPHHPKIQAVLDADRRFPRTTDVPPLLAEPPWTRPRKAIKPVVIKDLPTPGARAVTWTMGERDAWAARLPANMRRWDADFAVLAAEAATGKVPFHSEMLALVLKGPDDLVRPVLKGWDPGTRLLWDAHQWLGPLVARRELDAHDPVLALARRQPATLGPYLLPLLTDEIARTMAEWLVRLKAGARTARAWFRRHGTAAAPSLVPDALGKAGPARRAAEHALRLIADQHDPAPIVDAARVHGDKAAAAIETLLTTDRLDVLPKKIPVVDWAEPRVLPPLLLRDRAEVLPDAAAGHVLTMLAMPDYAGAQAVRDLCDPASLAGFGWALFRWWELNGAPSTESWAFTGLALTGDDETVRRLTPVIRAWPGDGGHAKAVTGLDVLATIGTETALMHLHSIARRVKFKALRTRAQEKIGEVAAELELTADQLADRLVPDFGLDASGTLTLDYGPRRFTIGFDEQLRPTITDEDGRVRASLPKPGAKDDPERAPAAHARFAALKKDVRTAAADQIRRLEQAMITGRRWPLAEFRDLLAGHPLLGHLVRRLVWLDETATAFRVAEDGTWANADDDTLVLAGTARVRVAHPVHLDELKRWSELFADYEIIQPFDQLARPVHALTEDEREASRLPRFEGLTVPVGDLLGLVRRGWERGTPMDVGLEQWISRQVAPDQHLVIGLDPGIPVGDPAMLGDGQLLTDVRLTELPGSYRPDRPTSSRLGDLDPVIVSEILTDLTHLAAEAE
ncbi:DUF4132 domain-containing protein [Spirillospora sp. NPDC047279]|uniref:DUF4132 domain-containing protein n=1 Tax=Spirillospora sp. NPDC047279 TaxID=3155478 RepID=UPI0033F160FC